MKKTLMLCMIAGAILFSAGIHAAETVKLRYVAALYNDEHGGNLNRPEGVACSGTNLVVADSGNGQLLKYVYQQGLFKFEGQVKITELSSPTKVQVNTKGEIYSFDEKQVRIVRINPSGAFDGVVKPTGLPAGESVVPRSFALDGNDNIYILDIASDRVLVLDRSGALQRTVRYPADYGFFSDIAVTAEGTIYALDTVQARLYSAARNAQAFSPLSEPLGQYEVRFPTTVGTDNSGMLFIIDQNGGSIVFLNPAGAVQGKHLGIGWKDGLLRYPAHACISGQGNLFIADRENNRVQVFSVTK
jgi:hypothetical protein